MKLIGQDMVTVYEEKEGIVIIELDSVPFAVNEGWLLDSSLTGFTGRGYLYYDGINYFRDPGNGKIRMKVNIQTVGKYRFQWHSRIATGENFTEHNDSWLRFPDASAFYGQKIEDGDTLRVYPEGDDDLFPKPNGNSSDGWLKVYQNVLGSWTWNTSTSDNDPHSIYIEFDSVGEYALEVSARSNGHAIDRLALYHQSVKQDSALDLKKGPSTSYEIVGLLNTVVDSEFLISPNAVNNYFTVDLPQDGSYYTVRIMDLIGNEVYKNEYSNKLEAQLFVGELTYGVYLLRIESDKRAVQTKFLKLD